MMDEPNYFNIEVSPCGKVLVLNGSKTGINSFYDQCKSIVKTTGEYILKSNPRPQRTWRSHELILNPNLLPTDPSPYQILWSDINTLAKGFRVRFLGDEPHLIFYAKWENDLPTLIVNYKGWVQFLDMLICLKDQSSWFYVVPKNPTYPNSLRFGWTQTGEGIFWGMECIRPVAEEPIQLHTSINGERFQNIFHGDFPLDETAGILMDHTIRGTSSGLLLLSNWLRDFSNDSDISKDYLNQWDPNKISWIRLRKIKPNYHDAILSFKTKNDGSGDLYIFSNQNGFLELAGILEEYIFRSDSDHFEEGIPGVRRYPGDLTVGKWGGADFFSFMGWYIKGGAFESPLYDPERYQSEHEKAFVNEKVLLC